MTSGSNLLAYRLDGSGETVLLLNGGMMSMAAWEEIAAKFSRLYRVLRCDFRGQMHSPGSPHSHLSGNVSDIVGLLDALEAGKVHVIGASFGAEVGLLLAAQHPSRVASLVSATATDVFDATIEFTAWDSPLRKASRIASEGGDRMMFYDLLIEHVYSRAYIEAHQEEIELRRTQVSALSDAWFSSVDMILATLEKLDLRPYMQKITCPVLVVIAELDRMIPRTRSLALAMALKGSRLEVVAGSGHALVIEQPDRFVEICLDFLCNVGKPAV
jgi:aminoacrylate hydrolase